MTYVCSLVEGNAFARKLGARHHFGHARVSQGLDKRVNMGRVAVYLDPLWSGREELFVVGEGSLLEDVVEELGVSYSY